MEDGTINDFLSYLEDQYFVFDKILDFSTEDFFSLGDNIVRENEFPDYYIPITAKEMLE